MSESVTPCWRTTGVWGQTFPRCEKLEETTHCRNCEIYINAGRAIFDDKISKDSALQWKEYCEAYQSSTLKSDNSAIVFRLDSDWFSLPVHIFNEILNKSEVHRIPRRTDTVFLGLVSVRGSLKICCSLEAMVYKNSPSPDPDMETQTVNPRQIVVELSEDVFVFPVSEIDGVIYFDDDLIDKSEVPDDLNSDFIFGVLNRGDKRIACLSPDFLHDSIRKYLRA